MLGEKFRAARRATGQSLADVAKQLEVSAATLSRLETNKQSCDLGTFLSLCRILNQSPSDLLDQVDSTDDSVDVLVRRIAALESTDRTQLWQQLTDVDQKAKRASRKRDLSNQVDELLAQVEFLRSQIESVRKRLATRGAITGV